MEYGTVIKNRYKLFTNLFIGILMIKSLIFQFAATLSVTPVFSAENLLMFLRNLMVLIILASLANLIFYKKYREVLLILNIVFSVVIFGDALYIKYYYTPMTLSLLPLLKFAGSIKDSVRSLFTIWEFLYLIDIPILIYLLIRSNKKENTIFYNNRRTLRKTITAASALIISFVIIIISTGPAVYSDLVSDNNFAIRKSGTVFFHCSDAIENIEGIISRTSANESEVLEASSYFAEKTDEGDRYKGICSDQNLIIVQMEAIENFLINSSYNGREITPNLNKFIDECVYFENFYHQVAGGNTSDAEFLVNNSLYPVKKGAVYFTNSSNEYFSLPEYMNNLGRPTYVLHPNEPNYWNRTVMYENIGFTEYLSEESFIIDETIGWGLTDSSFYRQSFNLMDTDNPFYAFYITLSSHHPFNFFADTDWFDAGEYEGTMFGNYIKAVSYADEAFGEFITHLKDQGLYDNSLLVVYGDHSAIPRNQADEKSEFTDTVYDDFTWIHDQEIPLMFHSSKLEPGIESIYGGQIDLMPTIANLMGFETKYAIGKDIFNTDYGYAVKRNKDIVTDDFTYINITGLVYDKEGIVVEDGRFDEKINELHNELDISDLILDKNVLENFKEQTE